MAFAPEAGKWAIDATNDTFLDPKKSLALVDVSATSGSTIVYVLDTDTVFRKSGPDTDNAAEMLTPKHGKS